MAAKITLILGGARSGKSRHAEDLVERSGLNKLYLATGEALDAEMSERIAHHRDRRGVGWTTIEEPLAVAARLLQISSPDAVVLVDCLTLWLSNLMHAGRIIGDEIDRLERALAELSGPVVFVTNEVGLGIVPEHPLARSFRDHQGRLNQRIAAAADHVDFIAAGLPIVLKHRTER